MQTAENSVCKILLIRTDRIGDVVLSLPMLPVLRKKYPDASLTVMVRPYTKELVEHHPSVSSVILWEESKGISHYVDVLKRENFDIVIVPYPRFNIALTIFLARIPIRVGTGYRWYSFLFNKKIYEHRKDAKRHEAEYNLNLLQAIGIEDTSEPQFEFPVSEDAEKKIDDILSQEQVKDFVVLHAGSGGSARDWPLENFARLADELQAHHGFRVVLTGGKNEETLVASVAATMKTSPLNFTGKFSLQELGALFRRARVFVSNSTGPLHIAAMVGTPVVAFYPPIIQCSPVRWGPYTKAKRIFTADNRTCVQCNGGPCQSNVCMEQITVEQTIIAIKELVHEKK